MRQMESDSIKSRDEVYRIARRPMDDSSDDDNDYDVKNGGSEVTNSSQTVEPLYL